MSKATTTKTATAKAVAAAPNVSEPAIVFNKAQAAQDLAAGLEIQAQARAVISPTVGRRVHFYPNEAHQAELGVFDAQQPCDAGVIYVWGDRSVNLEVTGPSGSKVFAQNVTLLQEGDDSVEGESYAAWMPYQTKKAAEEAATT